MPKLIHGKNIYYGIENKENLNWWLDSIKLGLRNHYWPQFKLNKNKIQSEEDLKKLFIKVLKETETFYETELKLGILVSNKLPKYLLRSCLKLGNKYYRTMIVDILAENRYVFELKIWNNVNPTLYNKLRLQMEDYQKCIGIKMVFGLVFIKNDDKFILYRLFKDDLKIEGNINSDN